MTLAELKARLDSATGPDADLNRNISNALGLAGERWWRHDYLAGIYIAEPLTASIDAALQLVGEKFPGFAITLFTSADTWTCCLDETGLVAFAESE